MDAIEIIIGQSSSDDGTKEKAQLAAMKAFISCVHSKDAVGAIEAFETYKEACSEDEDDALENE